MVEKNPHKTQMLMKLGKIKVAITFLYFFTNSAFAQEVDINTTVNTTGYIYETKLGENEPVKNESFIIAPSLLGIYSSKAIRASVSASHRRVETGSSGDTPSTSQNFTNFKYDSSLTLIENALTVSVNGAQNYRAINQQQVDFSDEIIGSGDLTKTSNHRVNLDFSIPNPLYFGLDMQADYSNISADQSLDRVTGIDNDNLRVLARLYQGRNIENFSFDLSARHNNTSRENSQDFKSTLIDASIGLPIVQNVDFLITGSIEEYDSGGTIFLNRTNIDNSSYGAGIRWMPNNNRSLVLTYNQLDEEENTTEFLGLDLDWAISSRTSINLDYSKRFYGDAYNFNFSHSLKSLRTSVSYSEQVTSFSRLASSNSAVSGIFVCDFGSTELADCFQPDSVEYVLQPGEEFRAPSEIDTDLTEEVLFRKSGNASIGYQKRNIQISLDATYLKTEYLESDRLSITRSLRLNLNYNLGRKTRLNLTSLKSQREFSELDSPDNTLNTSISLNRNLGRYLSMNISARVLDRESDNPLRNGNDKRVTVGFAYSF